MTLSAGDWVQVRSKEEILATLDSNGRLDGMPFMPQMFKWCGQQFQVYKRAHKTCDTVNGLSLGRRLPNSVHLLDVRCDGEAYGGCQAQCLIFWKEAWLQPVTASLSPSATPGAISAIKSRGCTEAAVWVATRSADQPARKSTRYACQATELPSYTQRLEWWDARQYCEDLTSGNVSFPTLLRGFLYFAFAGATLARRHTLGRPARWIYDLFQSLWGGVPFPRRSGYLVSGKDAPTVELQLKPGDVVRIRPLEDILPTIDKRNQHRGMAFDAEMVPFCGKVFRVRARVEKFVDERTGYLRYMKTPAVILDGVYCQSRYSENRLFCPRSLFSWWREIWLERVPGEARTETIGVRLMEKAISGKHSHL